MYPLYPQTITVKCCICGEMNAQVTLNTAEEAEAFHASVDEQNMQWCQVCIDAYDAWNLAQIDNAYEAMLEQAEKDAGQCGHEEKEWTEDGWVCSICGHSFNGVDYAALDQLEREHEARADAEADLQADLLAEQDPEYFPSEVECSYFIATCKKCGNKYADACTKGYEEHLDEIGCPCGGRFRFDECTEHAYSIIEERQYLYEYDHLLDLIHVRGDSLLTAQDCAELNAMKDGRGVVLAYGTTPYLFSQENIPLLAQALAETELRIANLNTALKMLMSIRGVTWICAMIYSKIEDKAFFTAKMKYWREEAGWFYGNQTALCN